MVSRRSMALLGMVGALGLLMGCGGEPWTETSSGGEATTEQGALVSSAANHYPYYIAWDNLDAWSNLQNVGGAPDGKLARFRTRSNSALRFDWRQGDEGPGNLRIHYQGLPENLPVDLLVAVDFLRADKKTVIHHASARMQTQVSDPRILEVPYPANSAPYSSVKLTFPAGLFGLDSIEATSTNTEPTEGCQPPEVTCGTECVDTTSNPAHCGACDNACTAGQSCDGSVCVGSGNLQFNARWSRSGDADLYVTTPETFSPVPSPSKTIYYNNPGPSASTDFGQLDRDDRTGMGPENIYWRTDYTPPSGRYHFCVGLADFTPAVSSSNPVKVTVSVRRQGQSEQLFSKTFTAAPASGGCDPSKPGYVGYLDHP